MLVGIGLEPSDQVLRILCRHLVLGDNQHRGEGEQRDRLEVPDQVVLNGIERAGSHVTRPIAKAERVAVRRGFGGATEREG